MPPAPPPDLWSFTVSGATVTINDGMGTTGTVGTATSGARTITWTNNQFYIEEPPSRRLDSAERQLQAVDAAPRTAPLPRWSCDDTLLRCGPVCMASQGVSTRIVADEQCSEAKPDECSCPCYYDAAWVCTELGTVCMASSMGRTVEVGGLVCESRGVPKPEVEATATGKTVCDPVPVPRGERPAAACLTGFPETAAAAGGAVEEARPSLLDIEVYSFAPAAALLAAVAAAA
jgi:hypothetical protein